MPRYCVLTHRPTILLLVPAIAIVAQATATPSLFHVRLKTFLFCKYFPPQPFLFFFKTDCMDSPDFYCYF